MIKSKVSIDCLGMGIIPFDLLFTVDTFPKSGKKIDAQSFIMQGGGPVPNVCIGLSRLGYSSALIATVGKDPFGTLMLDELSTEKVNIDFMIQKSDPTALASGFIEEGSGDRTLVLSRNIFVKPEDIKLSELPIPKIIHLDGRDMQATLKLAKWAKKNHVIVSFDIGSLRNDVSEVFPYVDHLVVADEYAFGFTKTNDVKKAILKLKNLCSGTVIVTKGVKGSVGIEPDNTDFIFQKAFKVKNIDTTGAGDCYHTGYLYGLLNDFELQKRMMYGSAAAALKCTKPGARTGIPTLRQLKRFINSNPRTY